MEVLNSNTSKYVFLLLFGPKIQNTLLSHIWTFFDPLGIAQWKIEFSPRSGELPQKVTQ